MRIFISGATGYLGTGLIPRLLRRGHQVCALCRPGSESKLPQGCSVLIGDALDGSTFAPVIPQSDAYIHLVGIARPSPWKARQFRAVDLVSLQASVKAAVQARIPHFVYVSVARPAPIMRSYQTVRALCEYTIKDAGLNSTILRPWYVLGPNHRWPYLLVPFYKLAELHPGTRESALRLGLVTREQMLNALVWSVEHPPAGRRYVDVPAIRNAECRLELELCPHI